MIEGERFLIGKMNTPPERTYAAMLWVIGPTIFPSSG